MLKEILVKDKAITLKELNEFIDLANNYQVDNICLPSYFLKYVNIKDISIAAQIDFPYGLSSNKTRAFEILYSIDSGASFIDLTINSFLIQNKLYKQLREELVSVLKICKDKRKKVRAILEYRLIEDHLIEVAELLYSAGVETVITSTGTMVNDPSDNLIATKIIMDNTPLQCIMTGVSPTKQIYDMFQGERVFGLRSCSKTVIHDIFGVVK